MKNKEKTSSKQQVSLRVTPERQRLGVLWVLLNVSTEYGGDVERIVGVMNEIEKYYKDAPKMWGCDFQIVRNGKVIYDWKAQ